MYDKSGKPIGGLMRMEDEQDIDKDCKGPAILEREIEEAIREIKNGKAAAQLPITDSLKRKPKGVKGISDSDYQIMIKNDSLQ